MTSPPVMPPGIAKLKKLPANVSLVESHSDKRTFCTRIIQTRRRADISGTGMYSIMAQNACQRSICRITARMPYSMSGTRWPLTSS